MILTGFFRAFLILCLALVGGCALLDSEPPKKPAPTGLIATPPTYYSTAKARYLGTKYKDNLDRLVERIVRNPKTNNLQFANNISSVGGIGFFTHSATKSADERYLEVVMATPETFETKGEYSTKVARLFALYGMELLSILSSDADIFQDKEMSGYGLNLAWRNISTEAAGNRVVMERAIVYFPKERVRSYVRQQVSQNDLLGDAVIFAVEEDGPLQLVSYRPQEVRPDSRPAIREDNLPVAKAALVVKEPVRRAEEKIDDTKSLSATIKESAPAPTPVVKPVGGIEAPAKAKMPAVAQSKSAIALSNADAAPVPLAAKARPAAPPAPEPVMGGESTETAVKAVPLIVEPRQDALHEPAQTIAPEPVAKATEAAKTAVVQPAKAKVQPVVPASKVEAPPAPSKKPTIEAAAQPAAASSAQPVIAASAPKSAEVQPSVSASAPTKAETPPAVVKAPVEIPAAAPAAKVAEPTKPALLPAAPKVKPSVVTPLPAVPVNIPAPIKAAGDNPPVEQVALLKNKPIEVLPESQPLVRPAPKALEGFIVQLAFNDKEKARRWAEGMEKRGYAVSVTEAGAEGVLRVRLGNFAQRDDAEKQLRNFKQEGLSGIIINLPQGFRPEARTSIP